MWEFPIDEGLVLARPDIHGLFLLNSSARLIWNQFRLGASQDEIVSSLVAHFSVSQTVARHDVAATIASWRQALLAPAVPPVSFPSIVPEGTEVCQVDCLVNGRAIRVLLQSGDIRDEIAPRLQPLQREGVPERIFEVRTSADRVVVLRDGLVIGNEGNTAAARAILLRVLATSSDPLAILHAGGCGGVLLAGYSQSGKSTLCASLMARGLAYHCDDTAVLDRDFRVAPMPFPIMVREGSWPLLEPLFPELKETPVYNRWGTNVRFLTPPRAESAPATALVFVSYEAAAETQITELSVLESLLALQRSGFCVEHNPKSIERFLECLARIRRYRLRYADLEHAERVIQDLAENSALAPRAVRLSPAV